MLPRNIKLKQAARNLRNNMTDAERKLWSVIRRKQIDGLQFYRQYIIGNFIVDFYCPRKSLVIEVDGGQHYTVEGKQSDQNRDDYLRSLNLKILRFSNSDVLKNIELVVVKIKASLSESP